MYNKDSLPYDINIGHFLFQIEMCYSCILFNANLYRPTFLYHSIRYKKINKRIYFYNKF